MGEGFQNAVINASGTLIRTLMKSANYVAGVSGWVITRDGDAEFNSVVVRGDIEIGPASPNPRLALTPNIPASLVAASADFDWKSGEFFWFNGTDYEFEVIGTYIPGPNTPIWAKGTYDTLNGVNFNWLIINSGGTPITYMGSNVYNAGVTEWRVRNARWIFESTCQVTAPTGYRLEYGTVGLGTRSSGFTVTAGAAPTAEVAIPAAQWDQEPTCTCEPNQVYEFEWAGQLAVSGVIGLAGGTIRIRVGSASIVGTVVATTYIAASTNVWEPTSGGTGLAVFTGAASAAKTFSLTIQRNTGAAGTNLLIDSDGAAPVKVRIRHVGDASEARYATVANTFT